MPDKAAKEILEFALAHWGAAGAIVVLVLLLTAVVLLQTRSFSKAIKTASTTETRLLTGMDVILTGFTANATAHQHIAELQGEQITTMRIMAAGATVAQEEHHRLLAFWAQQTEAMRNLVAETKSMREHAGRNDALQSERLALVLERLAGTGGGRRDWEHPGPAAPESG